MNKKITMTLPASTEPTQKVLLKLKRVNFISFVQIDFKPFSVIDSEKFYITLDGNLLFYKDKSTNIKYMTPISNIASAVLDE